MIRPKVRRFPATLSRPFGHPAVNQLLLTSHFEAMRKLLTTDHMIFIHDEITTRTLELAPHFGTSIKRQEKTQSLEKFNIITPSERQGKQRIQTHMAAKAA
ncbi:hypothetical protein TNCV_4007611 [Trichonephila clavipes]|nr:hypothetical protein TNCV_4007611 [Trichonephila clavipes]